MGFRYVANPSEIEITDNNGKSISYTFGASLYLLDDNLVRHYHRIERNR